MNSIKIEEQIIQQLRELPTEYRMEVLDFTLFLKQKQLTDKVKEHPSDISQGGSENARQLAELGGSEPDLELLRAKEEPLRIL